MLKFFCHLGLNFELWKTQKLTGAFLIVEQRIFDQARQDTFFIKLVLINVLFSNTHSQPLIYNLIYGNPYQSNIKSVSYSDRLRINYQWKITLKDKIENLFSVHILLKINFILFKYFLYMKDVAKN